MRRWAGRLGWSALAVVLVALIALMTWEGFAARPGKAPPPHDYTAQIVRDEWGVPHIYGRTDADAAYGVAIAHAEDDFATLQDVLAMTRGRYAAIAGEEGAQFDYALALLDARGTVARHYDALEPRSRALLDAYATGMNDYAARHPREIKLANLFPVNGRDVATGFALRQPFFFGLSGVIGPLVSGEDGDPEPGAPIVPPAPAGPLPNADEAALAGSNAFAIAPARSGDGVTRLVSNAHQPWRGGVAWYELVVESGEGWHFAGANFPGSPFPLLGHNENLGWTNTVNHPDMVDVYKLTLDNSKTRFLYEGKWLPLMQDSVLLRVRFGPLVIPVSRPVWRSLHGPVIINDRGAFAIRYGGMDSIAQIDAYYALNKARDYGQWKAVLARQAIPSTNFIYADKTGNIAYWYNAAIPRRPKGPDWRHVLPGDRAALVWDDLVPFDSLPHYENPASGFLFNANNTPFVATARADNLSAAAFPAEMGIETKMTNRAYRAARLMEAINPIGRAELERIKYDTGWEREGYVKATLAGIAALDLRQHPRLRAAQRLLARWDMTSNGAGRADALALLIMRKPMGDSYNGRKLSPPRELLEAAVDHLMTHFGRLDPPLQDLLRLRQGPGPYAVDLPLDGGSDTLRASTLWDVDDDGRLSVRHGDSFVMFIEWAPGGPVASQTIQPFGAATTRTRNVHFTDQSALFVQHKLKPVHFWRSDVLHNSTSRKTVTHRR